MFTYTSIFIPLPEEPGSLTPKRIFILPKNSDPNKITPRDSIKAVTMLMDVWMLIDDSLVVKGQEVIMDFKDAPLSYLTAFTPNVLKTIVCLLQQAYPTRIKGFNFVNVPSFAEPFLNILMSLFSEKIRNRVKSEQICSV